MKKGLLYAFITAITFTTLEPVSKLIADAVNPYAITCLRFFIGGLFLLPFAVFKAKKIKTFPTLKEYIIMGGLGILVVCFSMIMLQAAVKAGSNPSLISIVFSANSMFTIFFAVVLLKDRLTWQKIFGICLCAAGIFIFIDFKGGSSFYSIGLSLGAAVTFALYAVLCKKLTSRLGGIIQTCISFLLGSIVLFIALTIMKIPTFSAINADIIPELVYLSIVVTGIGYFAYFKAMDLGGATTASTAFFIKPILAPFAAFIINKIPPEPKVFAALILVAAGSIFITTQMPVFIKRSLKK